MSRTSSEAAPPHAHEAVWRRNSLLAIVRFTAVVGTAWLAAVLATTPGLIGTFFGVVEMLIIASVWIASFAPLSSYTRFALLEAGYVGTAANAILVNSSAPGIPVLLGLGILLAAIYHGRRGGITAGIVSLAIVAAAAWGWMSGALPIGLPLPKLVPTEYGFWMRTAFSLILAIGAITGIVAIVAREKEGMASKLQNAEEKFSQVFRICPDAMVITELATGRYIEVNDSHERLFGFKREEVVGRTSVELGAFESEGDRRAFLQPLLETGFVRNVEKRMRARDGRPIDTVYSAQCFDMGGVRCALTVIRDVSEWKRSQAAVMANEERFRTFVENANVGIYRSTPDGRIVMANPALLKIMGFDSFEEMAQLNLEAEGYQPSYPRKKFREGLEREGALRGWEAVWSRKDGSLIFVRESANVIRGPDGAALYYDGTIEDISDRKKAEVALRESEERFRNLTEAAFEGIVITENGRIMDINDQALKMLGYRRGEVMGRPALDFVAEESRGIVADRIRMQTEDTYEHLLLRKDGTTIQAEAQAKMMRTGDRTLRMTALRDITERKQNEQRQKNLEDQVRQMQKMEALGTLAGGIAHDFNNILTGILGNLQLARMDVPGGHPAFVALESADRASRRARDLVARILAFSRLEQENRAAGPLGPVVREAMQLLSAGLQGDVTIRSEIDPGCPNVVFDSGQMHQVIMNLGTNSLYAMRDGGGVLSLELQSVEPTLALRERHPQVTAEHRVRLTLRDNGCGMDEAVLKRIFEPFYTTKTFGKGTGLGLAMVHAIVSSHGGAIVVESAPGAGTAFDLYFPPAPPAARTPAPPASPAQKGLFTPFGRSRGVLLVDDEDSVLTITGSLLKRFGFAPRSFALPAQALEAFRADPDGFSTVITDLAMPEMTGLELARSILAIRPATPIILASGFLHADALQKARESGVRSVIRKPFEVKELLAQIRSVLDEPAG